MAIQIQFTADGKRYTLEFCRAAVKAIENANVVINEQTIMAKSLTLTEILFQAAMMKNHNDLTPKEVNKILCQLNDEAETNTYEETEKDTLLIALIDMYLEAKNKKKERTVKWGIRNSQTPVEPMPMSDQ